MTNIVKYNQLYKQLSAKECSQEELKLLKELYSDVIKSKRRIECIGSLKELLQVLQKRDFLNANNVECLQQIASHLDEYPFVNSPEYLKPSRNFNGFPSAHNNSVLPTVPKDPMQKVYQCIAFEIGHKWTHFARALKVPEGYIDELFKSRDAVTDRIYEILRFYEQSCDPRSYRSGLLDALSIARRNDLRKKVQQIYDIYL